MQKSPRQIVDLTRERVVDFVDLTLEDAADAADAPDDPGLFRAGYAGRWLLLDNIARNNFEFNSLTQLDACDCGRQSCLTLRMAADPDAAQVGVAFARDKRDLRPPFEYNRLFRCNDLVIVQRASGAGLAKLHALDVKSRRVCVTWAREDQWYDDDDDEVISPSDAHAHFVCWPTDDCCFDWVDAGRLLCLARDFPAELRKRHLPQYQTALQGLAGQLAPAAWAGRRVSRTVSGLELHFTSPTALLPLGTATGYNFTHRAAKKSGSKQAVVDAWALALAGAAPCAELSLSPLARSARALVEFALRPDLPGYEELEAVAVRLT